MPEHRIEFPGTGFPALELAGDDTLSVELTAVNSPVLFGCRSGLCGTCLVEVEAIGETSLTEPGEDEKEALEIYAPGNRRARLACQLALTTDLRLWRLESA